MKTILASMILLSAFAVQANEAKWSCKKDGKEINVEGKTADEKKADCEKQSGKWEEEKKEQKSGGGGGW